MVDDSEGEKCPKKTVVLRAVLVVKHLSLSLSPVCRYPGESAENKVDDDDEDSKEAQ